MARIEVLNPFGAVSSVTSTHPHHTPFGGTVACDMDVDTASRGAPVLFRLRSESHEFRGVVEDIRAACASGQLQDGGRIVVVRLERMETNGNAVSWAATGLRVGYAHLDPVNVSEGDVLDSGGTQLGALGPGEAQDWSGGPHRCGESHGSRDARREEYHSSCAVHSHLHLEGYGADVVLAHPARPRANEAVIEFSSVEQELPGAPETAEDRMHTVVAGDTLTSIAASFDLGVDDLENANPNLLTPGQELTIPGRTEYVVRPGDTLGRVAARFGISLAELIAFNRITNPDRIEVGQRLLIPGGRAVAAGGA